MALGRPKLCKYGCQTTLAWDDEESIFVEIENNNAPHDRNRCESLRPKDGSGSSYQQPRTNAAVKQAVNQDLQLAMLQELRKIVVLLQKIAGVEESDGN